ncbi:uncharacterized protein LOC120349357, partial [Nilaparvata lugens]|uniref:uncharacterized protein LOC120349357 n=1 Tax=Nilaparvata lugens TaxID=108931 RepID=UPI00193E808B
LPHPSDPPLLSNLDPMLAASASASARIPRPSLSPAAPTGHISVGDTQDVHPGAVCRRLVGALHVVCLSSGPGVGQPVCAILSTDGVAGAVASGTLMGGRKRQNHQC